jgi:hypothetical protein
MGRSTRSRVADGATSPHPRSPLLARTFGITAPFWFSFIGSALLIAVMSREFDHIAHAGDG